MNESGRFAAEGNQVGVCWGQPVKFTFRSSKSEQADGATIRYNSTPELFARTIFFSVSVPPHSATVACSWQYLAHLETSRHSVVWAVDAFRVVMAAR